MNVYIKNNLKQAFLVLEEDTVFDEDYQTRMLEENNILGLLKTEMRCVDEKSLYRYDISGKISLKTKHEKKKLNKEEIERLIRTILDVVQELPKYMLETKGILLSPEYIYCEGGKHYFCYYPPSQLEPTEEFHKLTEFLVREVDYQDKEGIHLAYTLHKASMEENYSIEKIMEEVLCEEEIKPVLKYDEHIDSGTKEAMVIEEKKELWGSVRRFLFGPKEEKNEEWEGFLSDGDDL